MCCVLYLEILQGQAYFATCDVSAGSILIILTRRFVLKVAQHIDFNQR